MLTMSLLRCAGQGAGRATWGESLVLLMDSIGPDVLFSVLVEGVRYAWMRARQDQLNDLRQVLSCAHIQQPGDGRQNPLSVPCGGAGDARAQHAATFPTARELTCTPGLDSAVWQPFVRDEFTASSFPSLSLPPSLLLQVTSGTEATGGVEGTPSLHDTDQLPNALLRLRVKC